MKKRPKEISDALLILGAKKKSDDSEPVDDKVAIAEDVMAAIADKDAEAFAEAFAAMYEACAEAHGSDEEDDEEDDEDDY